MDMKHYRIVRDHRGRIAEALEQAQQYQPYEGEYQEPKQERCTLLISAVVLHALGVLAMILYMVGTI